MLPLAAVFLYISTFHIGLRAPIRKQASFAEVRRARLAGMSASALLARLPALASWALNRNTLPSGSQFFYRPVPHSHN